MDIDRRRFAALLTAASVSSTSLAAEAQPEVFHLAPNGWMPNNPRLPLMVYRAAVPVGGEDPAGRFEKLFALNGWPPQWRNGVYTFHHCHSTAHELLGFAAGSARIVFGGEGGRALTVNAGDIALLPSGTGHCELEASNDFLVVGAYPPAQHWDICRTAPDAQASARMAALPFPRTDPVHGAQGPLSRLWTHA